MARRMQVITILAYSYILTKSMESNWRLQKKMRYVATGERCRHRYEMPQKGGFKLKSKEQFFFSSIDVYD